ncbi:MAG: DNA polymerase domain-containing protein, partial [Melioribacteraceae bacterium]|nr:DNA polymerase domain-containing protein [Melioribacteraceae bacterium]
MELPENFYKLVEQKGFLKYILYGDTDSIFLTLPVDNAENIPTAERWRIAEHSAEEINKLIVGYTTGTLLPRCNISPEHNKTFFKTELLIDAAMFMEVKKNYSYLLSCKEGVILDPPKISHTGIPVIKSDAAKLTQEMLGSMIKNVMLNSEIKRIDRAKAIVQLVTQFKKRFDEDCDSYQFDYMGFPAKWSKKEIFIHAMKLYNFIMNEEIFNLGSSG